MLHKVLTACLMLLILSACGGNDKKGESDAGAGKDSTAITNNQPAPVKDSSTVSPAPAGAFSVEAKKIIDPMNEGDFRGISIGMGRKEVEKLEKVKLTYVEEENLLEAEIELQESDISLENTAVVDYYLDKSGKVEVILLLLYLDNMKLKKQLEEEVKRYLETKNGKGSTANGKTMWIKNNRIFTLQKPDDPLDGYALELNIKMAP